MRPLFVVISTLVVAFGALALAADAPTSSPGSAQTKLATLSAVRKIRLEPSEITLQDGRDTRRVLVLGETDSKGTVDLTARAVLKSDSPIIEIDAQGYIAARTNGQAVITVAAAGKQAKLLVRAESGAIPPVGFVRDVMPILSKVGCNAGTCHGSAKGKNGFKLSLRGYDPDFDYQALVNDLSGRRFNRVAADDSLMLLKPLAEVPHEGRQAIKPDSRYHHLLRQWIAEGVKPEEL